MICVDGDSVAWVPDTGGTWWMWPELLAHERGTTLLNLAKHESTARDCMLRMWKAVAAKSKWYVLCVGQWSQNHEPVDEFEKNVRTIIEHMHANHVGVVLLNYPKTVISAMHDLILEHLAVIYKTGYGDLKATQKELNFFQDADTVKCHFNAAGARAVVDMFNEQNLCR